MKKRITVAMLILAIALAGCTATGENNSATVSGVFDNSRSVSDSSAEGPAETEPDRDAASTPQDTDLSHVREVHPQKPRHGENKEKKYKGAIPELLLVDASSDIPERIPVFIDPYPGGRGGREDDPTEAGKDIRRRNLTEFLDILYENHDIRDFEEKQDDSRYLVSYHTDRLEAWGRENGVQVYTKEYGVREDAESGAILENKIILAAMKYIGVTQPQVRQIHAYRQADGGATGYTFRITEQSGDVLENMVADRFRFVSVSFDAGDGDNRDTVRIVAEKSEAQELTRSETLSYTDALAYVRQKYADRQIVDIRAEARYEKTVTKGYFVPCYQFFVEYEKEQAGQNQRATEYDTTYILMAKDWDPDTPAAG